MTDLERAAAVLVDRPPAPPPPLESIECRAESIRRRRRVGERLMVAAVLLAVVSLLAVVVAATDSDQSLKVTGPTPTTVAGAGPFDLTLAHPISDPQLLVDRIRARYMAFGHPDAQVELVDPLHIHIELPGGAVDQFDAGLGQAAGGFELRPVLEDLSDCSTGGSNPDGSFTARTSGPNGSCYRLAPAVDLGPAGAVGRSVSSPPPVLQLSLTDAAVSAALDVQQECVRHDPQCPTGMVALTSMLSIVDPDVSVASTPSAGGSTPGARVSVRGFSTDREAEYQAILLSIPLPAGVLFQGSPSTYSSTIVPTSDLSAGAEMSWVRVLCLSDAVDATLFASIPTVVEARFASIGRTVRVAPYLALPGVPAAGCISGQSLTLASNYDSGDPSWAGDQISMLRGPGIVAEEVDPRRLATLLANPLPAGVSFQQ